MKTDEVEMKWNSLHGEMEKSFFGNGKSLALGLSYTFVSLTLFPAWKR